MSSIQYHDLDETDRYTSFIRFDQSPDGNKMWFVRGKHHQNLQVVPEQDISHLVSTHSDRVVREIADSFIESVGLDIPDTFAFGTSIYNVRGLLHHFGVQVPFRVLRQQIFLSGGIFNINDESTYWTVYHALGNALWNFLDHNVWMQDTTKKNEYRELRGMSIAGSRRSNVHQKNLFYIAAEDFRYLFGPSQAGREEWNLPSDGGFDVIGPPPPSIIDFWKKEISGYGDRDQNQQEEEDIPQTQAS